MVVIPSRSDDMLMLTTVSEVIVGLPRVHCAIGLGSLACTPSYARNLVPSWVLIPVSDDPSHRLSDNQQVPPTLDVADSHPMARSENPWTAESVVTFP